MSNMYEESEYETNAMRALREKAEADSKTIREMAERLQKMEEKQSRADLVSTITEKGLDAKVVDLIPKDVDPGEWLKNYEGLFAKATAGNSEPLAEEQEVPDGVPADEAALMATAASAASGGKATTGLKAVEDKIQSFDNQEDLLAYLQSLPKPSAG